VKSRIVAYSDPLTSVHVRGSTLSYYSFDRGLTLPLYNTQDSDTYRTFIPDQDSPSNPDLSPPVERPERNAPTPARLISLTIPRSGLRYRLGIGRLGRRLVRGGIRHVVALSGMPGVPDGSVTPPETPETAFFGPTLVAVAGKRFYRIDPTPVDASLPGTASTTGRFPVDRCTVIPGACTVGSNPLCTPAVVAGPTDVHTVTPFDTSADSEPPREAPRSGGTLYYGEYRANPERSPVHVWRSVDGAATFHPAWTFTDVRHVHGVFVDPFDASAIWVTTGDDDTESAIWRTDDAFATLQPVVRGGQQARAVDLVFTPDAVYFGSDTPRERNFLYRLDRRTGAVERQQPVSGSVFWGHATPDGWRLFSTVVEKSAVNTGRYAELWAAPPDRDEWRCIYRARKDLFHDKYFDHGQLRFPAGPGTPGAVWVTPYAVTGDQRSIKIELASSWADAPSGAVR